MNLKNTFNSLMYPSRLLLDPQRATYQATSFFFLPFSRIRILLSIKKFVR